LIKQLTNTSLCATLVPCSLDMFNYGNCLIHRRQISTIMSIRPDKKCSSLHLQACINWYLKMNEDFEISTIFVRESWWTRVRSCV